MPTTVLVPIADEQLGPAIRALNDKQRLFVAAMFMVRDGDATAAARAAGYVDAGNGSISVQAHRLIHNPKVQEAIQEYARQHFVALAPKATQKLEAMVDNEQHQGHVKAVFGLLNRAGLHEIVERHINVKITLTREEKIAEIKLLAEQLGVDPTRMIGQAIDAEFVNVPTPDETEEEY